MNVMLAKTTERLRILGLVVASSWFLSGVTIARDTLRTTPSIPDSSVHPATTSATVELVVTTSSDSVSKPILSRDTLTVVVATKSTATEDDLMDATPVLKVIAVTLGLITLVLTYFGYRLNVQGSRLARTQWYAQLFTKFYEETTYKDMRRRLDFKDPQEIKELTDSLERDSREKLSEDFYDYLTFFEFMATLEASKQITLPEMLNLFRYYLNDINQQPFIRSSLPKNDFKLLTALLVRLEDQGELDPAPPPISPPEKAAPQAPATT